MWGGEGGEGGEGGGKERSGWRGEYGIYVIKGKFLFNIFHVEYSGLSMSKIADVRYIARLDRMRRAMVGDVFRSPILQFKIFFKYLF